MKNPDFNIIAIVPARGGSKKVPRKNIKILDGKPLLYYTIREAKKSKYIDRIIVTTDDREIADIALKYDAEVPFLRPGELAGDNITDLPVFQHCIQWIEQNEKYQVDVVVHLRVTAPLRTIEHIDKGIELLLKNPSADSLRSLTIAGQHPMKMWMLKNNQLEPFIPESQSGLEESYNMPRQRLPKVYIQNASVDVIWCKTIIEKNSMCGDKIIPFIMDEDVSVNIDTKVDFILAETLLKKDEQ